MTLEVRKGKRCQKWQFKCSCIMLESSYFLSSQKILDFNEFASLLAYKNSNIWNHIFQWMNCDEGPVPYSWMNRSRSNFLRKFVPKEHCNFPTLRETCRPPQPHYKKMTYFKWWKQSKLWVALLIPRGPLSKDSAPCLCSYYKGVQCLKICGKNPGQNAWAIGPMIAH